MFLVHLFGDRLYTRRAVCGQPKEQRLLVWCVFRSPFMRTALIGYYRRYSLQKKGFFSSSYFSQCLPKQFLYLVVQYSLFLWAILSGGLFFCWHAPTQTWTKTDLYVYGPASLMPRVRQPALRSQKRAAHGRFALAASRRRIGGAVLPNRWDRTSEQM